MSFVMPPSGSRYFYPASARDLHGLGQQQNDTIAMGQLLDMSAAVIWDFFFTFLPVDYVGFESRQHAKYMKDFIGSKIEAVFAASAPWLIVPHEREPSYGKNFKSDLVYRDPNDPTRGVIVFNELTRWGSTLPKGEGNTVDGASFSPEQLADRVSEMAPGSLVFIYDIIWEVNASMFQKYASRLKKVSKERVVLVDHRTLIDLGKQKYGLM
jgi:hypothetical protein